MLTALAADERTAARSRSPRAAWSHTSTYDLVDQFTDLAHAADAAARRRARAA